MKVINQAIELIPDGGTTIGLSACNEQEILTLLKSANKKSARLESALVSVLECLVNDIRYKTWPTIGLGIGLNPEKLDEIIMEAEAALTAAKRGR